MPTKLRLIDSNNQPNYLAIGQEYKAPDGKTYPGEREGKKCAYLAKEVLPIGTWTDTNKRTEVYTPERIDRILGTYKKARDKGFEPPLPSRHPPSAGDNYGYVVDARKNDKGNLEVIMQVMGEDSLNQVLNKKVSIGIADDYADETGEVWSDLMDHVAVVPNAQITKLDGYKLAFAASRDVAIEASVYSREENVMPLPNDLLARINKVPGVTLKAEATAEEIANALLPVVEKTPEPAKIPDGMIQLSRDTNLEKAAEALPRVKSDLELVKKPGDATTWKPGMKFGRESDDVIDERVHRVQGKLDSSILPRDLKQAVTPILLGATGSPNRVMLSRDSGQRDCAAAELLDVFIEHWPKPKEGTELEPVPAPRTATAYSREAMKRDAELIEEGRKQGEDYEKRALPNRK